MNINQNINKLLYALGQRGQLYRINSFKFYSEVNNKYSTKYQVLKRKLRTYLNENMEIEYRERYEEEYNCYSKIDLMKYLAEEYRKGSEADGE